MTDAAHELLSAFDTLPVADREAVLVELIIRNPIGEGSVPDGAFEQLADELFATYAAAEATDAAAR